MTLPKLTVLSFSALLPTQAQTLRSTVTLHTRRSAWWSCGAMLHSISSPAQLLLMCRFAAILQFQCQWDLMQTFFRILTQHLEAGFLSHSPAQLQHSAEGAQHQTLSHLAQFLQLVLWVLLPTILTKSTAQSSLVHHLTAEQISSIKQTHNLRPLDWWWSGAILPWVSLDARQHLTCRYATAQQLLLIRPLRCQTCSRILQQLQEDGAHQQARKTQHSLEVVRRLTLFQLVLSRKVAH